MKRRLAITIILLSLLILGIYKLEIGVPDLSRKQQKFDQISWKEGIKSDVQGEQRFAMIEDLQQNHIHLGMTKKEITDLLGKPDDSRCGGIGSKNNNVFSYRIGNEFLDPCSFDIEFDKNGRVISFEKCCN